MKPRSRPVFFLLLAFTLLFAQQGAALHALSHLGEPRPTQSQQDKQLPHSPACEKCVLYAGMGSAITSSGLNLPAAVTGSIPDQASPTALLLPTRLPFHSRAPPGLIV